MDTQATEPVELNETAAAADAFSALTAERATPEETLAEQAKALDAEGPDTEAEEADTLEGTFTIEIDGKQVNLTQEQVAEAYKSGLRQSDYSRKTAELAQEKHLVQDNARQERDAYAQKLSNLSIQLEGALQEQSQIDWSQLLESDPVEYLKQQHLYQQRQAAYQNTLADRQNIQQEQQYEQNEYIKSYMSQQSDLLIQKIPSWKNADKATAEKGELRNYLKDNGFDDNETSQVTDHRHVILIRKAMQMDKLLKQSTEATKKVQQAPLRVERSGTVGKEADTLAKAAIAKLGRSGSIEDAASAFATLL